MSIERQICISVFNKVTKEKFNTHPNFLGHNKKVKCMNPDDIVLLYDLDTKKVFGICILLLLEDGKIYRKTHPYDQNLYDGKYIQYSKYEIGVRTFIIEPVSVKMINEECGLQLNTKLMKGPYQSFRKTHQDILQWALQFIL